MVIDFQGLFKSGILVGLCKGDRKIGYDQTREESDRFLTLITTDGGDPDGQASPHRATDSDWCVFAEPILELVPAAEAGASEQGEAADAL